ncbi:MAG: DUF3793 family protein [Fretibacterium sp.]|nr:DUF3793 family protein [Fretibacterium sp.]
MMQIQEEDAETYIASMVRCFAAPTLEGLKAGSLLTLSRPGEDVAAAWRRVESGLLRDFRVKALILREGEGKALLLVYQENLLLEAVSDSKAQELLSRQGYPPSLSLPTLLSHLQGRFDRQRSPGEDFPHEVGLFLGYPPEDVEGFIRDGGTGNLAVGYWKVYGNVKKARRAFRAFRRAERKAARAMLAGTFSLSFLGSLSCTAELEAQKHKKLWLPSGANNTGGF